MYIGMKHTKNVFLSVLCAFGACLFCMPSCSDNRSQEEKTKAALEKKGGIEITMKVDIPYVLDVFSGHNTSEEYQTAMALAKENSKSSRADFLSLFFDAYELIAPNNRLASVFASYELRGKVDYYMQNYEVEQAIRSEVAIAISNSMDVLRSRLNRGEYKDACVREGNTLGYIVVEIPGISVENSWRLTRYLQGQADVSFWETYECNELMPALAQIPSLYANLEPALTANGWAAPGPVVGNSHFCDTARVYRLLTSAEAKSLLPRDVRFLWSFKPIDERGEYYQLIALKAQRNGRARLYGDVITEARAATTKQGFNEVSMMMNPEGARKWQYMTKENIGRCIAIVVDGKVYSYPRVMDEIAGGHSQITGNFTEDEANDLANMIMSGQLPAPVHIAMENDIKPKK